MCRIAIRSSDQNAAPRFIRVCPGFRGRFPPNQLWVTARVTEFSVIQECRN